MAKTNLQLKAKDISSGKAITTTLTYVNPEADSATLKTFGQMLNGLTTNQYDETNRIQTINVDTEDVPTPAPATSTLTLNVTQYTLSGSQLIIPSSNFTYTGTGQFLDGFGTIKGSGTTTVQGIRTANLASGTAFIVDNATTGTFTLKICIPGTTAYDNTSLETQIIITS